MRITYELQFDLVFHPANDILTCTRVVPKGVVQTKQEEMGTFSRET